MENKIKNQEVVSRNDTIRIKNSLFRKERVRIEELLSKISQYNNVDELLTNTTIAIRESLKASRVLIYHFENETKGTVIKESLVDGWTPSEGENLPCICFGANLVSDYYSQKIIARGDIEKSKFTPYQKQLLDKFQVKAFLTIPIVLKSGFNEETIWGLMVVHYCDKPHQWQEDEINLVSQVIRELTIALQYDNLITKQQKESVRDKSVIKIIEKIRDFLDLKDIFSTTTKEVRKLFNSDRAIVYRFNPDWSGSVVAESVGSGWVSLLVEQNNDEVLTGNRTSSDRCVLRKWSTTDIIEPDSYLKDTQGGRYSKGQKFTAIDDIYTQDFPPCYVESLEKYQAKAYIIAPIFQDNKLWGLLGIYQNDRARTWTEKESEIMVSIASQLGIALKQAEYVEQLKQIREEEASIVQGIKAVNKISNKIREAKDIDTIFQVTTLEVRRALKTDRTVVYKFNEDWSGSVIAESVGGGWISLLVEQNNDEVLTGNRTSSDRCVLRKWSTKDIIEPDSFLKETQGGRYARGQRFTAVNDIYERGFPDCYIKSLEKYEAKAYLIAPIFQGEKLWGLLGAYQNDSVRNWNEIETDLITQIADSLSVALQQVEYIDRLKEQAKEQQLTLQRTKATSNIINKVRQANNIESIFKVTTQEVRKALETDRTVVYKFRPDWSGTVIAESVGGGWISLLVEQKNDEVLEGNRLRSDRCVVRKWSTEDIIEPDAFLRETQGGRYTRGQKVTVVDDIYKKGFPDCYINSLEKYQAKAYLIAPIFQGEKLWGLLGAYQNDRARNWNESEADLIVQTAGQLGVALQQAELIEKMTSLAERERKEKEELQQAALKVLIALQPSFSGDLTVRAPLCENEIGTIADGYNTTIQSMREIVRQVQETATRVNNTSSNNSISVSQLSEQAQEQVERLNTALTQLNSMVTASRDVMVNVRQVKEAVKEANSRVLVGDSLMQKTVDGILEMRETSSQTAKKIKKLGESSQKISKVVNLIENFATQTNLLSLNAAIEATRAGEYGKGFAVVADEVRSLAYQSANATTEIERLIEEIQKEVNEVNSAMEIGISQVVRGSQLVEETRQGLSEIVSATNQITEFVEDITEATVSQNERSETLSMAMNEVSSIAKETFASSSKISESFQELLSSSYELQTSVSKFKVD